MKFGNRSNNLSPSSRAVSRKRSRADIEILVHSWFWYIKYILYLFIFIIQLTILIFFKDFYKNIKFTIISLF